jgi:hypothetical protein
MPEKKKPTGNIDLSALGGRKILDSVSEKPKKPIDLSHLGGRRVGPRVTGEPE